MNATAVIDNGANVGFSTTGSWTLLDGGYNLNSLRAASSGGSATATWTFTGLAKGYYDVYVTYFGQAGYSSRTLFTVYDGTTKVGQQPINEAS